MLVEPLGTGLTQPLGIVDAGDGTGRLFLLEQPGRVLVWDGTQVLPTPFLDLTLRVSTGSERGLLGLAFHPRYAVTGFFYVNYTNLLGNTIVARYSVSADRNVADPASELVLLDIAQPFSNHNGGQLGFGPDGFLYIALGDGGSGGDPLDNAQNLGTLLGKILRIDVDTGSPFSVPPTNPFVGTAGARDEIWAYGLRNPWRFSFDRLTGDLFIADVGQSEREEVNFQAASSPGGENYGWRLMEGSLCFNPPTACNDGTLTVSIIEYDHSSGDCSITGGFRYRGDRFPQLQGVYLYADFCTGRLWGASPDSLGNWLSTLLLDTDFRITTFGEDEQGELYLADFAAGTIYRLVLRSPLPQLSSLAPASLAAGGQSFTLTVNGTGFVPASVVRWNATARPTTFISPTELQAAIPASDIGVSGSAQVTVFNPAPGGGASNAQTFTITDFSLDVSPASRIINAGQSAGYTVTITAELGSFGNSVSLACSNLPSRTSCSFSPSQLTPNNSSVTSALTVSTTASSASLLPWLREQEATPLVAFWLFLPGLVFLAAGQRLVGRKKSRVSDYFMPGLLLIMLLSQLACGGGGGGSSTPPVSTPGTPTGTHTITITGTSGSVQHSITVTLIVQ